MGLFDPISSALSGVDVSQTWMNAISDNIANMNDVTSTSQGAYQARYVVATSVPTQSVATGPGAAATQAIGSGTAVVGIALGSPQGVAVYDPTNPLADKQGMVRAANVDLGQQMTSMLLAERGYQANLAVISQAEGAYQAALGLKA
jgi:flagellar basal-body rod protein FlgC